MWIFLKLLNFFGSIEILEDSQKFLRLKKNRSSTNVNFLVNPLDVYQKFTVLVKIWMV